MSSADPALSRLEAPPLSRLRRLRWWLRRRFPRTLFGRTLVILVTPVLLTQAIAAAYFYDTHWESMTLRLTNSVAGQIAMVVELIEDQDAAERSDTFNRAARHMALMFSLHEGARLGQPPADRSHMLLRFHLHNALENKVGLPFTTDLRMADNWAVVQFQQDDGVLQVLVPRRQLFSSTSQVFMLWMVGSGLILLAVAILFMRDQIRPIRRLARAAESFGKGRDVPHFKLEGAAEVRQAARAFLVMRERVLRQMTQRTEMLAGVSHDLRTPLTRMKLQLAMLGDGPEIDELRADVDEMESMIDGYLAFARGESGEAPQPTNLMALLEEAAASGRREGAEVTLTLLPRDELDENGTLMLPLRRQALKRAIANLLSNARRYGGQVWIAVAMRAGAVEIAVDDDGPGIPDEEREEVFRPFYRLDRSRNRERGGTGLGLTIARDVLRSHGGEIALARSPQGGLRCLLRLPL